MPPKRKRVQPPRVSTRGSTTLEVNSHTESTQMSSEVDSQHKRRYETPPEFDPEKITYDEWKTSLSDWCFLTGTPLEDQGTAVRMHLLGTARQAAQHVGLVDIRSKQGVQKLLVELDRVFIPDTMVREFTLLHKLFRTVRPSDKSVSEFLNEFSDQYLKVRQAGETLPDKILSYLLLSACDMGVDKMQLIMSSLNGSVAFDDMKHQIKLISSVDVLAQKTQQNDMFSSGSETFINKTDREEATSATFYNRDTRRQYNPTSRDRYECGRSYERGHRPERYERTRWSPERYERRRWGPHERDTRSDRDARGDSGVRDRRKNPRGNDGQPRKCMVCKSEYHYVRDCPDVKTSREDYEKKIMIINFMRKIMKSTYHGRIQEGSCI